MNLTPNIFQFQNNIIYTHNINLKSIFQKIYDIHKQTPSLERNRTSFPCLGTRTYPQSSIEGNARKEHNAHFFTHTPYRYILTFIRGYIVIFARVHAFGVTCNRARMHPVADKECRDVLVCPNWIFTFGNVNFFQWKWIFENSDADKVCRVGVWVWSFEKIRFHKRCCGDSLDFLIGML